MTTRALAYVALTALLPGSAFGQQTGISKPKFEIADVHVSERSDWSKTRPMQGGYLNGDRYEIRRATMLDLVRLAYGADADKIMGGPSWLDYNRFEVVAKAPAGTRPEALQLMLQALLAERFGLVVAAETKPMQAYVLTAPKGQSKLKSAEGGGGGCTQNLVLPIQPIPNQTIQCRGVTMAAFAADLRRFGGARLGNLPVADNTGLEGTWDLDIQYEAVVTRNGEPAASSAAALAAGLVEPLDKQLGLTLTLGSAPQPVLAVKEVREQPTANPAGVAAALPPLPTPEFEVATLKPCDGTGPTMAPRFEPGRVVTARCMPLMSLITQAFGLATEERPDGIPKWLAYETSTARNVTITAKAPEGNFVGPGNAQDRDALNAMLRALLIERYQMKIHYEDRQKDAYTLTAGKPKMTKADPAGRTGCTRQPVAGNARNMRLVCLNITMGQFAEQMQGYDAAIPYAVANETGLDGAWDFTLTYDIIAGLIQRAGLPSTVLGNGDPTGVPTFLEAVEKQMGLKLETRKRMVPVLVIDHIEETPTEN